MNVVTIIQARMGSTRLPGKVLLPLGADTVLGHVVRRVRSARRSGLVIVATSDSSRDDAVAAECNRIGVPCFRGSETDVLDRYYACARECGGAEVIVRVTADCPLVDPEMLDATVDRHVSRNADYVLFTDLPVGTAAETLSMEALEFSWQNATAPGDREHVVTYIQGVQAPYKVLMIFAPDPELRRPDIRLTLDTAADYRYLCSLFNQGDMAELPLRDIVRRLGPPVAPGSL